MYSGLAAGCVRSRGKKKGMEQKDSLTLGKEVALKWSFKINLFLIFI